MSDASTSTPAPTVECTIWFGSEGGTAVQLAVELGDEAESLNMKTKVLSLEKFVPVCNISFVA